MKTKLNKNTIALMVMLPALMVSACSPTVKVEAPDKPITINLNVNISHEIRVKVDKDLENAFDNNSGIF